MNTAQLENAKPPNINLNTDLMGIYNSVNCSLNFFDLVPMKSVLMLKMTGRMIDFN